MNINQNQYTPIDVSTLVEGMQINYSIYCEKNGEYVLLCNDTTLTEELIRTFHKFTAPSNNIYIPDEHFQSYVALSRSMRHLPAAAAPAYAGYDEMRTETAGFLSSISADDTVPAEATESITKTIHTQIQTVDVSLIIQSINSVRVLDEYLHTHSSNVALLNGLIAKWMKYSADDLQTLVKIGLLHDIGKLKIPSEVLNKPGKLTAQEFEIIKQHPVFSCEMLAKSGVNDKRILLGVMQHHEKVNGQGYPRGLPMEEITEFAKITSISDIYDAMVAKRVYKDAHSPFEILAWFAEGCYSDLDIYFVKLFLNCMTEELRGKDVLLSDGSVGQVVYVDPSDFNHPLVDVGGKVVQLSDALQCVSLYTGA